MLTVGLNPKICAFHYQVELFRIHEESELGLQHLLLSGNETNDRWDRY